MPGDKWVKLGAAVTFRAFLEQAAETKSHPRRCLLHTILLSNFVENAKREQFEMLR